MEKFGRYEIKAEIGRGGMATVYHAYDPRFERDVAIKVLPEVFLHDPQFRTRFEREAKTIALLEHPAIVPVYDFGEENGQPYIVMRFMSGGSLADRLIRGRIALEEAVQIITRLAPALDAAHARGVIHRDLKPGNILFDQYGNAFLSDFGIARLADSSTAMTLTGNAIIGTPSYMSPEQIQGSHEVDGRSDIYALSIILFQMLTGVTPFKSDTPAGIMMKHVLDPVPDIHNFNTELPPAFTPIIEKGLAKNPDQRYATTTEMSNALELASQGEAYSKATAVGATRILPPVGVAQPVGREVSRPRTAQPLQPAKPGGGQPPGSGAAAPVMPLPEKKKFPVWLAVMAGAILILGVIGAIVIGVIALAPQLSAEKTPTSKPPIVAVLPTHTKSPLPTQTETPLPTETQPIQPTATQGPAQPDTVTPTVEEPPTLTPTTAPQSEKVGGADKIAFLSGNNIWVSDINGNNPVQMTNDGGDKSHLQWTPDGEAIVYITGKCVRMVWMENGRVDDINCFEAAEYFDSFEISPTGAKVAISLDHELYIIQYNLEQIQQIRSRNQLKDLSSCPEFTPYSQKIVRTTRWSKDETMLAVVYGAPEGGKWLDTIGVLDVRPCAEKFPVEDNFPASRFTMSGYNENPYIQNFSWDGIYLFALNSFIRNGGFGDLYIYNMEDHKLQTPLPNFQYVNPIDNICCYRDPVWSPDGRYLMFAFQDIRQGESNQIQLYYIPAGTIGTGTKYDPLPLPGNFFPARDEALWPALRAAK